MLKIGFFHPLFHVCLFKKTFISNKTLNISFDANNFWSIKLWWFFTFVQRVPKIVILSSMLESNPSFKIMQCNKTSLIFVQIGCLHQMILKIYKYIESLACLIEKLKWWWVTFNKYGVLDKWQCLQHFSPLEYECLHIAKVLIIHQVQ